jgi:hypothetical protein
MYVYTRYLGSFHVNLSFFDHLGQASAISIHFWCIPGGRGRATGALTPPYSLQYKLGARKEGDLLIINYGDDE